MAGTVLAMGPEAARAALPELAELLRDAVAGGASVGFDEPVEMSQAIAWWDRRLTLLDDDAMLLLGYREGDRLLGTVQLLDQSSPNARHRAEVAKLLVHSSARRRGIGRRLMHAVESEAASRGKRLLILDTETGSNAEALYARLGWDRLGEVPDYFRGRDGDLHPTTFFFKRV